MAERDFDVLTFRTGIGARSILAAKIRLELVRWT